MVAARVAEKLVLFSAHIQLFGETLGPFVGRAAIANGVLNDDRRIQLVQMQQRFTAPIVEVVVECCNPASQPFDD